MRIALLSDIHGNLVALEAVLADLDSEAVDAVICLGDVVVTGPQPRQVIALLQELHWPIVMGNTDAWLLDPQPWDITDEDSERLEAVELWGASLMTGEDLAFIRTFQPTVSVDLGNSLTLLGYHGSPQSSTDIISPTTPEDELQKKLAGYHVDIMAGGHIHQQMLRSYQGSLLINPGSVGLPYQTVSGRTRNPPWAEYALVTNQAGQVKVEFRRVPVDLAALETAVRRSSMPHAGWWLKDWG
jgi:predicted phosphodiesterase